MTPESDAHADRAALIAARQEILRRVRVLLIEQLHVRREADEIDPDCPLFATGLGLDSVDAVELVVGLESEFGVTLADGPAARRSLRTVNTLVDRIIDEQTGRSTSAPIPGVASLPCSEVDLQIAAIRTATAWSEADHVVHLRISGEGAFALLDRVVAGDLVLRDGQLLESLLLDAEGQPFADVALARSEDEFLLYAEGPGAETLVAHLRAEAPSAPVTIERLDDTHAALSLHGPYAWELLGELMGPEIAGVPYGGLFIVDGWLGLRVGKTGEYGYDLLIPRSEANGARARIAEVGARFDLRRVGLEALDRCALENGFFCIRHEGQAGLTPLELQLQWRVSRRKDYVGAGALRARREQGIARRVTHVVGPASSPLAPGDRVLDGDREVGMLLAAGLCVPRGEHVALGLLDLAVAHAGGEGLSRVGPSGERSVLRTLGPPVIHNRSLFVSPQRHSWATRATDELPPLVGW